MFLQAGFNGRHFNTGIKGWTRHVSLRRFAPAELIQFQHGDLAWHGHRFLSWGEQVVLGSHYGFKLADEHQRGLPHCDIATRREFKGWKA